MHSFSGWSWVIVLLPLGMVVWLMGRSKSAGPATNEHPEGIGGWLAALAFGQFLSVLRSTTTALHNYFSGYARLWEIPGAAASVYSEIALNVVLIVLGLATAQALFAKKRIFTRLFFMQWIAQPLAFIIDLLCVSAALNIPVSTIVTPENAGAAFGTFVGTGFLVWYTQVSVRVKNTMVN